MELKEKMETEDKNEIKVVKTVNTLVLLSIFIVLAAVLTYVLPAGTYDRVKDAATGRMVVVPGSYHNLNQTPVSLFGIFKAIPTGMESSGYIMMFLLIIGGAFRILQATGTIEAGIGALVNSLGGREKLIIPIVMIIFSLGGAMLGTAEETLAFMPLIVSLCLALGFDSITGVALLLLGAGAGFAGCMTNPFTLGIAQGIAGLPMFSGIQFRAVVYLTLIIPTIAYVYMYASKIHKNPELSPMYKEDQKLRDKINVGEFPEFNTRHKMVLLTLVVGIIGLVYGVLKLKFYITELGAIFVIIAIVSGIVGGLKINTIADEFVNGAKDLLYAAIIVGFAKAITVVMTDANIMDTIIYQSTGLIKQLPPSVSAVAMFVTQSFVHVLIPSGSGQAAVVMPILAPMADVLGITRQTAVLSFQFGDAFTNVFSPTCGYFMAALAMFNISWGKWAKWFLPLFTLWYIIAMTMVVIATNIKFGPF